MPVIAGAELLTSLFGAWPTFHDAEVLRLALDRGHPTGDRPSLEADIYTFEITPETDARGYYVLRHEVLVTLRFEDIEDLDLSGFNEQNVLFALTMTDTPATSNPSAPWEVSFHSSYGLGAYFKCRSIEVRGARPWASSPPQLAG
jgi:hypothetical protein